MRLNVGSENRSSHNLDVVLAAVTDTPWSCCTGAAGSRNRLEHRGIPWVFLEEQRAAGPLQRAGKTTLAQHIAANLSIDGSAGKYFGDWIADFDPRSVQQLRIVLADFVGNPSITIRDVSFSQRTFSNSGMAQSLRIAAPQGTVLFRADQHFADTLTSISHQISTDGVHYTAIVPGQQLAVGNRGFWYRANIERLDANFSQAAGPLSMPGQDPNINTTTSIANITTVDLGSGILERSINLASVSGTVTLNETPLGGTLVVYQGTVVLPQPGYTVAGNQIAFPQPLTGITLRYQTSSYANAGLGARKNHFTPYLYGVSFERL